MINHQTAALYYGYKISVKPRGYGRGRRLLCKINKQRGTNSGAPCCARRSPPCCARRCCFPAAGGDGSQSVYTVHYSDGSTTTFTVENGKDGADLNIEDVYQSYCERYGEIEFSDFLEKYLDVNAGDNTGVIQKSLQSAVTVYAEFCVTQSSGWPFGSMLKGLSQSIGSGVIYEIDDSSVYFVTNYHVVYNSSANADNGSNIGRRLVVYLYGSEDKDKPAQINGETDELGYPVLDYGAQAITCEFVGGTSSNDLAVLRADKDEVFAGRRPSPSATPRRRASASPRASSPSSGRRSSSRAAARRRCCASTPPSTAATRAAACSTSRES